MNKYFTHVMSTAPFEFQIFDEFLPDEIFDTVFSIYRSQQFTEISSDLFSFLNTNEINNQMVILTDQLTKKIFAHKFPDVSSIQYNVFGSIYQHGDYLLCHDDCVDNREYAFTYYLNTCKTGALAIYENDCKTLHKEIQVKKNRLVIFKVSDISFHEVKQVINETRCAITGWVVSKNKKLFHKQFNQSYNLPKKIVPIEINICIKNDFTKVYFDNNMNINNYQQIIEGPFVNRRVIKIDIIPFPIYPLPSYNLIHCECLLIDSDGYILSNDIINNDLDVLDGFFFYTDNYNCISYVDPQIKNGPNVKFSIDSEKNTLVFIKRNGLCIYVSKPNTPIIFTHYIYKFN